jgi:hypothetical protein
MESFASCASRNAVNVSLGGPACGSGGFMYLPDTGCSATVGKQASAYCGANSQTYTDVSVTMIDTQELNAAFSKIKRRSTTARPIPWEITDHDAPEADNVDAYEGWEQQAEPG